MSDYLRLLVLGAPKVGKTQCVLTTAPGPVFVINSDGLGAQTSAKRAGATFDGVDLDGLTLNAHSGAVKAATTAVQKGAATVVWDTITLYCEGIESAAKARAPTDKYGQIDMVRQNVLTPIRALNTLSAHVIIIAHYLEVGEKDGAGRGIEPMLFGALKRMVPAHMQDIVLLQLRNGERVFVTSPTGVFGIGCRNLQGVESCKADVGELLARMRAPP